MTRPPPPIISLMGVPLHEITAAGAIDLMFAELEAGRGGWVITPNLDILRRLTRDPAYARLCDGATLRVADGMPLIWASRLQGTPLPERVAGSELIWGIADRAAATGRSLFFLGGNPGSAQGAADHLQRLSPGLRIAGVECPPMGFEQDAAYVQAMTDHLVAAAPDVCFVGLGPVKQDRVIAQLRPLMPRTWFLGIGITFSYVCGEVTQAPRWMRRIGLEWAFRLLQEPRRLGRRYLAEGVPFAVHLLAASARQGLRARPAPR